MIKTIFYVLSVLIIGGAAYFAFDVKQKLEGEMALFEETESTNAQVSADTEETEGMLADTEASLEKAKVLKSDLTATKDSEGGKTVNFRKSIEQSDSEIEGYDAELIKFEEVRKKVEVLLDGREITLREIPAKIAEFEEQRKVQQRELERLIDLEAKLSREVAGNRAKAATLTGRLADLRLKISRGSQQGVVTAVDSIWGFVVINQGAGNSNVTDRSELLVSRGGRLLGRLKVTSLEPNRAICDIDTKSVRPGVRIQTGDRITLANGEAN
jgi:hypothetical protein